MIKNLINGTCAKCGEKVDFYVIKDESFDLNLNNYNIFKRPIINVCPNCNYINEDLSENNELFNETKLILDKDNSLETNLLNNIKLDRAYLRNIIDFDKKIRVLANIYENNKLLYNNFLKDNYTKEDDITIEKIRLLKSNIKNSCEEIISLLNDNSVNSDFIDILKIEVLCSLNKIDDAKKLLSKYNNLSPDLYDYLDDCIMLGGIN